MLGFVESIDLGGQDEIALRQTVDFVRPGRDLDFSPRKRDVRVDPQVRRSVHLLLIDRLNFSE